VKAFHRALSRTSPTKATGIASPAPSFEDPAVKAVHRALSRTRTSPTLRAVLSRCCTEVPMHQCSARFARFQTPRSASPRRCGEVPRLHSKQRSRCVNHCASNAARRKGRCRVHLPLRFRALPKQHPHRRGDTEMRPLLDFPPKSITCSHVPVGRCESCDRGCCGLSHHRAVGLGLSGAGVGSRRKREPCPRLGVRDPSRSGGGSIRFVRRLYKIHRR